MNFVMANIAACGPDHMWTKPSVPWRDAVLSPWRPVVMHGLAATRGVLHHHRQLDKVQISWHLRSKKFGFHVTGKVQTPNLRF